MDKRIIPGIMAVSLLSAGASFADDTATTGGSTPPAPQTYSERMAAESAAQAKKAAEEAQERKAAAEAARNTEAELQREASSSGVLPSTPAVRPEPTHENKVAPLKLYGRIEELDRTPGAKIPLKMQAMVPIRDSSLDKKLTGKAETLSGVVGAVQSYPTDFRGSWTGEITVNSSNFDPSYFQYDAAEAKKESELMRPGVKGSYTVNFYQGNDNKIAMQPSQVVFQGTDSMASQMKLMEKSNPQMGAMFGAAGNPMMANMRLPIIFALHMGTPMVSGETGVTGNQISSELMKNTLRELSKGVIESEIVTKERDRNPETGKVQDGFSESVLRFTRLNANQLYLQAAYVYYRKDGKFQSKYMFYGTLSRGSGQPAGYPANPANPFGGLLPGMGGGANPFGGMMPGGGSGSGSAAGGVQDLTKQLNQMTDMLKKMGGH